MDRCAGWRTGCVARGTRFWRSEPWVRDPGDEALLRLAAEEGRVLVTIDSDFGALVHVRAQADAGLIRLPDVPAATRIQLMAQILADHPEQELSRAVVTVKGRRIRISRRARPTPWGSRPDLRGGG